VVVVIEGTDLPGRRCGPSPEGHWYENIHVGLGRPPKLTGLMPGDAPAAQWELEITLRTGPDGEPDFRGPFVHGKRGERCLYLSWGEVTDDGTFELSRAPSCASPTFIRALCLGRLSRAAGSSGASA
jgi:hypothetical protein